MSAAVASIATQITPPALIYHRAFWRPYTDQLDDSLPAFQDPDREQQQGGRLYRERFSKWETDIDRRLHRWFQCLDKVKVVRHGVQPERAAQVEYFTRYFEKFPDFAEAASGESPAQPASTLTEWEDREREWRRNLSFDKLYDIRELRLENPDDHFPYQRRDHRTIHMYGVWRNLHIELRFTLHSEFFDTTIIIDLGRKVEATEGVDNTIRTKALSHIQDLNGKLLKFFGVPPSAPGPQRLPEHRKFFNDHLRGIHRYLYHDIWSNIRRELFLDDLPPELDTTKFVDFRGLILEEPRFDLIRTMTAESAYLTNRESQNIARWLTPFLIGPFDENRQPELTFSRLLEGRAIYASALGASYHYDDGPNDRIADHLTHVMVCRAPTRWQVGRFVDRLNHLGTLRLAALRDLPLLNDAASRIERLETQLSGVNDHQFEFISVVAQKCIGSIQKTSADLQAFKAAINRQHRLDEFSVSRYSPPGIWEGRDHSRWELQLIEDGLDILDECIGRVRKRFLASGSPDRGRRAYQSPDVNEVRKYVGEIIQWLRGKHMQIVAPLYDRLQQSLNAESGRDEECRAREMHTRAYKIYAEIASSMLRVEQAIDGIERDWVSGGRVRINDAFKAYLEITQFKNIYNSHIDYDSNGGTDMIPELSYRANRSANYVDEFNILIPALRIQRIEGYQPYDDFIQRRMFPTYRFIARLNARAERIQQRIQLAQSNSRGRSTEILNDVIASIQDHGEQILLLGILPYYLTHILDELHPGIFDAYLQAMFHLPFRPISFTEPTIAYFLACFAVFRIFTLIVARSRRRARPFAGGRRLRRINRQASSFDQIRDFPPIFAPQIHWISRLVRA